MRWHAEQGLLRALGRRRGGRAQRALEARELLHGAAVHEPRVQRARRLQRQRGRRPVRRGGRQVPPPQYRRAARDQRVERRRRVTCII